MGTRTRRKPATGARRPNPPRLKLSVTVEREAVEEARRLTENLSGFVNEAIKDKLYFARLDHEARRLQAGAVPLDRELYDRLRSVFAVVRRRAAERRRAARAHRA